jgi:lipoprotein-anchoring transpeptidase ErfK/SrfK
MRLSDKSGTRRAEAERGGILIRLLIAGVFAMLAWIWWANRDKSQPPLPPARAQTPSITSKPASRVSARTGQSTGVASVSRPARLPDWLVPATNPPPSAAAASSTNSLRIPPASKDAFDARVFEAQVALACQAIASGPIDGVMGSQTRAALRAFQRKEGLPPAGELDEATRTNLTLNVPLLAEYAVTSADLARLQPLAKTWLGKSQQDRLDYETLLELVSEKGHANPKLVRRLNPEIDWTNVTAGTVIKIPNAEYPAPPAKAAFVEITLAARLLEAFDAETNLLAHFPCSIAQNVDKRPVGELHVAVTAPNPNYTFNPEVFPESAEARELGRKLILQPGPNNPVGTVWIGLDRPGYGIHGTPRPEEVGRTESHGCFRLANWNVEYLLQLVRVGTPVFVKP